MGRVEEALRRAAGTESSQTALEPVASVDLDLERGVPPEWTGQDEATPADGTSIRAAVEEAVLATPANALGGSSRLVGNHDMLTVSREQYRRLAASLHQMQAMNGVKVILIVSAMANEGKTLTASNLALTLSESYGRDVLLVDADLRRPSLARTFGIPASPGLSDGLTGNLNGKLTPPRVSERLTVLPAGRAMHDPMAGLTSPWLRQLVAEARDSFDWVIIDTPPIGLMTDANLLAHVADGVVLVVKANETPYQLVKRAVDAIGPSRLLGAVLNRVTEKRQAERYYYGHYRHYAQPSGKHDKG